MFSLKEVRKSQKLTQKELGDLLGCHPSFISQIENGSSLLPDDTLSRIKDLFSDYFLRKPEGLIIESSMAYTPSKQKLVPYYDVDFVGGFELVCNSQTATPTYFVDFQQYNEGDCWCNVTGHSMEPKIGHGDKMCLREVKRWKEFLPFGEVYAIVTEEFRTVKIITKSDKPDHFKLVPFNPDPEFAPQDIPISMIQRVFRVLGCCKNL